jgi:hypothetical protein
MSLITKLVERVCFAISIGIALRADEIRTFWGWIGTFCIRYTLDTSAIVALKIREIELAITVNFTGFTTSRYTT